MSLGAFTRRLFRASGELDLSVPYITMWDSITPSVLPSGTKYAYLGYVDGKWPTYDDVKARFPGQHVLDMAVFFSGNASALDIETGDATISEAPAWHQRQVVRGVYRPALYIQASNQRALEEEMARAHIDRSSYRLLVAHYTGRPHLCGPHACGYGLTEADGTQFATNALGVNLDEWVLVPDFFDARPAPQPVIPAWEESMMNSLPTLQQGDTDKPHQVAYVGRMQELIRFVGERNNIEAAKDNAVDGDFGLKSANALQAVQQFFGITGSEYAERKCGPETWAALVTGSK